jgi:hypothetical protein
MGSNPVVAKNLAGVAKLVDAPDLGSGAERFASSNLASRIFFYVFFIIIMGYSQEVKAPVFDTGIPGSNPGTPEHLHNFF